MTKSKTNSKTIAAALVALTLAGSFAVATSPAQAHHAHWGPGIGIGFAAGALIGAAVASSAYAQPAYGYADCRYVERYDRWGNLRTVRVCNAYPY